MKKVIILSLFILTSFIGFGQTTAKNLLDEVAEKIESYDNISLKFNHKLDNDAEDVHQETRGDVTLKGDLYHLNYMGTEHIFDGKKTYMIIHEDEEVIVKSNSDDSEGTITPSQMFTFYKNGYTNKMDILQTVNGRKIQYVKLIPIDSNSEIKYVLLGIDIKTKHIYKVIEVGKNNTKTSLVITSFKTNQPISNNLFTFDDNKYRNEKKYIISEPN